MTMAMNFKHHIYSIKNELRKNPNLYTRELALGCYLLCYVFFCEVQHLLFRISNCNLIIFKIFLF